MYAPANEVSELAKCVFLGRIPDLWWAGEKPGLLGKLALNSKSQVRKKLDSTTQLFNDILRGYSEAREEDAKESSWQEEVRFQARYNKTTELAFRTLYWQVFHPMNDESDDHSEDPTEDESYDDEDGYEDYDSGNSPLNHSSEELLMVSPYEVAGEEEDEISLQSLHPNSRMKKTKLASTLNNIAHSRINLAHPTKCVSLDIPADNSPHLAPIPESHLSPILDSNLSPNYKWNPHSQNSLIAISPQSLKISGSTHKGHISPLINITPAPTPLVASAEADQKVKFQMDSDSHRHSRVSFAHPKPEDDAVGEELHKEYIKVEHNLFKKFGRLHTLASKSKRKALKTSYKVKGKVSVSFLKKYKVGDILRIDKMLVIINKEGIAKAYTSSRASRTENRLGEYYVVLRKGPSLEIPLVVQLFDPELYGDFSGKPEHKLELRRGDTIKLYSNVEKSFKVTEAREDTLRVFIFIPRFSKLCFMWMFLVQTILGDSYVPVMSIHVDDSDVSINIPVSGDLFPEVSGAYNKELELSVLNQGYRVKYDFLIDHLLKSVKLGLSGMESQHQGIKNWMSRSDDMWLCFKFFDRLEWVANDTDLFLIQHHIQRTNSQLEVRQKQRTQLDVTSRSHKLYPRPHPIEGFLSRITNTAGEDYSNLRAFYKIQYFHTADNILFFTKLYLSVPPSAGNILLDIETHKEDLEMPEIFVRSPFQTDNKGHIPWLISSEFEKFDQEAVGEFIRRVQQITKASAMVDLCTVKEIIPLPHQDILKHHLYFQSFFWHSSSVIINDESLMDSGFQLVLLNGGRLKLLAPSRFIRDQWIERLTKIVEYWRTKKAVEVVRQVQVRKENMEKFEVKEHVDSNATTELQGYFSLSARPNDILFDSTSLSMPTNLVKSGYIYNKLRKHSDFNQRFLVLCPGYLMIFRLFKRSKTTGIWKQTPCFERYMTLPLSTCYIYSGDLTLQDLLDKRETHGPGQDQLSRFYADGWKSSEEDSERCFSVWFGKKRMLQNSTKKNSDTANGRKLNPGLITMIRKLGFTGKKMTFLCRSRQERESWAHAISSEIDRLSSQ